MQRGGSKFFIEVLKLVCRTYKKFKFDNLEMGGGG